VVLGIEFRISHLLGRCSTTWVMAPWLNFQIGSCAFCLAGLGLWSFFLCLLHNWDYRHDPLYVALPTISFEVIIICKMKILENRWLLRYFLCFVTAFSSESPSEKKSIIKVLKYIIFGLNSSSSNVEQWLFFFLCLFTES
jgi:hypothetical protein